MSSEGRCPYYDGGYCYSPKTLREYGGPVTSVVDPDKCLTDSYRECPYYVEEQREQSEITASMETGSAPGLKEMPPLYLSIHAVPPDTHSDCPYFYLVKAGESVYVARCRATDKYLTRSAVEKCVKYWRTCPYYLFYKARNL